MGHYLTVVGYDNEKREIYGYDTYLGPFDGEPSTHSFDIIRRYWQHFNYTFYVVYPPDREVAFQTIISKPLQEPMSMWEQAAAVAQQEIEYAPENAFAWFNLGTSLTRLGELTGESAYYANAVQAFDQALSLGLPPRMLWYQFRPYIAYMKTGRYEDVLILTDAVLATQGGRNVEETYLYRGHTLALQGDILGASAAYERAIQLNENFYPARWALDSLGG
jgi:tetratricopeptide (TPR) repeat protein